MFEGQVEGTCLLVKLGPIRTGRWRHLLIVLVLDFCVGDRRQGRRGAAPVHQPDDAAELRRRGPPAVDADVDAIADLSVVRRRRHRLL